MKTTEKFSQVNAVAIDLIASFSASCYDKRGSDFASACASASEVMQLHQITLGELRAVLYGYSDVMILAILDEISAIKQKVDNKGLESCIVITLSEAIMPMLNVLAWDEIQMDCSGPRNEIKDGMGYQVLLVFTDFLASPSCHFTFDVKRVQQNWLMAQYSN